ncbi:MAG: hypothetical protein N2689_14790 [Verrucomicrobiae bacterium]|nr:hypothetical protein [Verrucomicrobiae bacterium]
MSAHGPLSRALRRLRNAPAGVGACVWLCVCLSPGVAAADLRIAAFQADVTPPIGSPLCHGSVSNALTIVDPLTARGVVLLASGQKPIVLCAVDWVANSNAGYDAWRAALADAAGTTVERVAVHTVHQHDAPGCDFSTEELLPARGLTNKFSNVPFAREAIARAARAARKAIAQATTVTHIGVGQGKVEQFASNRRVLGPDGKVKHVRMSACRDPKVRAEPEGIIDPFVRVVSFWENDQPRAALSYYAVHPMSYYGRGGVSADTVGIARSLREAALPGVPHIHFNGAGGNVTAGKYNDGSPENRPVLARRLARGMEVAWKTARKSPLRAGDVEWRVRPVALPLREELSDEAPALKTLADTSAKFHDRARAARQLVWARRCKAGHRIDLSCLRLGSVRVLHMPGELFVEYQLAAQQMRPDATVCVAAYGDDGCGYIGTEIAYSQGGYETTQVSQVAPRVEQVLMEGMRALLER